MSSEADELLKIKKKLPVGMGEEIDSMSPEQLRSRVVESEGLISENAKLMRADEALQMAKERIKELQEPYKEAKKAQTAIIQYSVIVMEEKGLL